MCCDNNDAHPLDIHDTKTDRQMHAPTSVLLYRLLLLLLLLLLIVVTLVVVASKHHMVTHYIGHYQLYMYLILETL